jgi:hydrogenase maturation protease
MSLSEPNTRQEHTVRIIGIGNDCRGDDGVGLVVARLLAARALAGVEVLEQTGDGAALLELWRGAQAVLLIDAMVSGNRAGTVRRFAVHEQPIPAFFRRTSSHAFGVAEAIELARSLGQLPAHMALYGIEAQRVAAGMALSPAVERAAHRVAARVADEALTLRCQTSADHAAEGAGEAQRA